MSSLSCFELVLLILLIHDGSIRLSLVDLAFVVDSAYKITRDNTSLSWYLLLSCKISDLIVCANAATSCDADTVSEAFWLCVLVGQRQRMAVYKSDQLHLSGNISAFSRTSLSLDPGRHSSRSHCGDATQTSESQLPNFICTHPIRSSRKREASSTHTFARSDSALLHYETRPGYP